MTDDELLQRTLDAEEVTVHGNGSRQIALLVKEVREHRELFDRHWEAEQRGIKSWQDATGRHLTWPDTANFTLWLLGRLEAADTVIQAARELGKVKIEAGDEITNHHAMALHTVLHLKAYDKEYPTPLNDPDAECCRIGPVPPATETQVPESGKT